MHFCTFLFYWIFPIGNIKSFVNLKKNQEVSTRLSTLRYASAIQTGQELSA